MDLEFDYDNFDGALRRCGANWDAAQAHGLLAARLAIAGADAGFDWLAQVLEGTVEADALRAECESMLRDLFEVTYRQLAERQSEFVPMLPGDAATTVDRAAALGRWCEGFLHGLVSGEHSQELRARLAAEPLAEIIKDMLQMTRADTEGEDGGEADEAAYAEIVEYLRVAAQLAYEELADFRHPVADEVSQNNSLH